MATQALNTESALDQVEHQCRICDQVDETLWEATNLSVGMSAVHEQINDRVDHPIHTDDQVQALMFMAETIARKVKKISDLIDQERAQRVREFTANRSKS